MDQNINSMHMLDLMIQPGFCVRDYQIIYANPAARSLLLQPGTDIRPMLATGEDEYGAFTSGCLYLTLELGGEAWGASVTAVEEGQLFLLEEEQDNGELQAMALAARELREPLSSVMTTAQQLFPMVSIDADPQWQDQAARLNRGLYQMLRIIGNMADAQRYCTLPQSNLETVDIPGFLQEVFDRAQVLMAPTAVALEFENLPRSLYCLADREKLERAVLNILSNSMKFTRSGGTIRASLTQRGKMLHLCVRDKGDGIPEAIRSQLHQRFLRQPGVEDGRFGIGLGMVLIRSAAAIHGGAVLIDQPEGQGTRITMTIAIRQKTGGTLHSPRFPLDYTGELDHALVELSDSLPASAYDPETLL